MTTSLNSLIEALREELQQYGEMLALLDQQQDLVVQRATGELVQCVGRIEAQAEIIVVTRRERHRCQTEFAAVLGLSTEATFHELLPLLAEEYRPLVHALVEENNRLLIRVHQRSRQNHLLLTRAVDLMQRLMCTLLPATDGPTYDQTGAVPGRPALAPSLYSAIG